MLISLNCILDVVLAKIQIQSACYHYNLQNQQHGKEKPEIPVLRLVMKHLHPQHAAQSSKACRYQKQPFLRYAPLSLASAAFVMSHQRKGSDVHNRYDGQGCEYNRLLIH